MTERFGEKFPRARIAQTVEEKAAKEFGPQRIEGGAIEGIEKSAIAHSLNLKEREVSPEEWEEIYEFSINAGAALIQSAASQEMGPRTGRGEMGQLEVDLVREAVEKDTFGFLPYHDIFHAAATYRLTEGKEAAAQFAQVDPRERYIDPTVMRDELYPLLFFAPKSVHAPLPVLLTSLSGRDMVADMITERNFFPEETVQAVRSLLLPKEAQSMNRRIQYESLVREILIGVAHRSLQDVRKREVAAMREGFAEVLAQPPEIYDQFARRVFNEEWRTNPRLFLEEFLTCIRTQPKPQDSAE